MRRLHQLLYGRHFTLCTDHKPLLRILGENSSLSSTVVARLQRWSVILAEYSYTPKHLKGTENVLADCLPRLPPPLSPEEEDRLVHAIQDFTVDPCAGMPVSADDVAKKTKEDNILSLVYCYVQHSWPSTVP